MLLSELQFASFLTYAPHGTTDEMLNSKRWTNLLKLDQIVGDRSRPSYPPQPMSRFLAEFLNNRIAETPVKDFLGPNVILVPVPGSSLLLPNGLWVPRRIARALVDVGLGRSVEEILERTRAIRKAAYCAPEDRPKAREHYNTLRAIPTLEPLERILLVDDVITRGTALLGAASRVAEACPNAEIRGFAMIRTISDSNNFVAIRDPCVGEIRRRGEATFRNP